MNKIIEGYFTTVEDNLIYLDTSSRELYVEDLNSCNTDQLFRLIQFFSEHSINRKELSDISESDLFSQNHDYRPNYSESFFIILGSILVYHESVSNNLYTEDLNGYNQDQIVAILGFFTDHEIGFIATD